MIDGTHRNLITQSLIMDSSDGDYFSNTSMQRWLKCISSQPKYDIELSVNCPGGAVDLGLNISNEIKNYKGYTSARINGICTGMAAVIVAHCQFSQITKESAFMICGAKKIIYGNEMASQEDLLALTELNNQVAEIFERKTKLDKRQILELINGETWMTAQEAVEKGFVDNLII